MFSSHVVIDERLIKIYGDSVWFDAAVDPSTDEFLHDGSLSLGMEAFSKQRIGKLLENQDLDDTAISSTAPRGCVVRSTASTVTSNMNSTADTTPSNIYSKR